MIIIIALIKNNNFKIKNKIHHLNKIRVIKIALEINNLRVKIN